MAFSDFIANLQKRPRYVKIQIMWAGTIICVVVIFGFWLWSLGDLMAESRVAGADNDRQSLMTGLSEFSKDMPTLWSTLGAGIGNAYDSLTNEMVDSPANEVPAEYWLEQESLPLE